MLANRFRKLDFGKGGEAYKANMTNLQPELHKIFISNYSNLSFVLKTGLETTLRSNSGLIRMYRQKIKPKLQGARIMLGKKAQSLMGKPKVSSPQGFGTLLAMVDIEMFENIFFFTNLT